MDQAKRERSGMSVEINNETEAKMLYQSTFSVLVSERIASEQVDLCKLEQMDCESAALMILANQGMEHKTVKDWVTPQSQKVTIEEIGDKVWIEFRNSLKSLSHIIESVKEIEDEFWHDYYNLPKSSVHILESDSPEPYKMKESLFTHENKDPMSINIDELENPNLPPPLPEPPLMGTPIRLMKKNMFIQMECQL